MYDLSNKVFFWYWLSNIKGLGVKGIQSLLDKYGSPERIYYADEKEIMKQGTRINIDDLMQSKKEQNVISSLTSLYQDGFQFIHWDSEAYPEKLRTIYDPPYALYLKGKMPDPSKPCLAMVGSRKATCYGIEIAKQFSSILSKEGIQIISGLAEGIDAASHKGALSVNGYTMGVLGGGIDTNYPLVNYQLYMEMYEKGGVISEYNRGVKVNPGMFPMRNRIISGLSDGVFVLEAAWKSGSFITADRALEQGREIFALPGRITDPMSEGCNNLISLGATIVRKPEDILDVLYDSIQYQRPKRNQSNVGSSKDYSGKVKKILDVLDEKTPMGFEKILHLTKLTTDELIEELFLLEVTGEIIQIQQNQYVKKTKL